MWECVACDIGCFLPRRLCAAVAHKRRIRARSALRASCQACLGLVSDCANWHLVRPSRVPLLAAHRHVPAGLALPR